MYTFKEKISIIMFCPRTDLSLQTQYSPFYPLLNFPSVSAFSPFIIMLSIIWYLLLFLTFFPFTIPSTASFSRQFLLSQWPVNLFSSSLSVPALFLLLPLFLAQLNVLFCVPVLHVPSFFISTYQMLPVVFAHSVVVSKSLQHTTILSTQSTSLICSVFFFQGPAENAFFFC